MSATARPSQEEAREAAVSVRRFVNDEVARVASRLDGEDGSEFEFVCECSDLSCDRRVRMTLAAYGESTAGSVLAH